MAEIFMYEDILNTLIELETRGVVLYSKLASAADSLEVQKLMTFLSEQEHQHQLFYQGLKKQIIPHESASEEYHDYLEALLDQTYSLLLEAEEEGLAYGLAIKKAKSIEMATLVLLNEFKKMMDTSMTPKIDLLMNEERRHLKLLYSLEKKAKG